VRTRGKGLDADGRGNRHDVVEGENHDPSALATGADQVPRLTVRKEYLRLASRMTEVVEALVAQGANHSFGDRRGGSGSKTDGSARIELPPRRVSQLQGTGRAAPALCLARSAIYDRSLALA
jgi:hypothetical protein